MANVNPKFTYYNQPYREWEGVALRDLNNGFWRVLEPIAFMGIKVPAFFETDLYSIPRLAQMLIPKVQKRGNVASIFHDYIIEKLSDEHPREYADTVFMAAMKASGVKMHRRLLIHGVVSAYTKTLRLSGQLD